VVFSRAVPRDHHVRRALALQRDPSLPPSLELTDGLCAIARPDGAMKERIERRADLPACPGGCAVRRFFERAAAEGADVELDVGAGYGRFGRAHAAANPGTRVLGIEQESARVARSDVIARRAGIRNVAYLVAEARYALEFCVPPDSVAAAFLLFPDPWPKDRHARNRLFRAPVVSLLHRALRRGGVLHAATDDEAYFGQMLEVMRGDDRFEPAPPYERGEDEKTDFEIKFLGQGRVVRAASWRKR